MGRVKIVVVMMCCVICLSPMPGWGQVIYEDNFDGYADSPENHGWSFGSAVSVLPTGDRPGRCVRVDYTTAGTANYYFRRALNRAEAYVRFFFKRTNYNGAGGCKFIKFFGQGTGVNYANVTCGQQYNNGRIRGVSCGPGVALSNDTQCLYSFAQSTAECGGTVLKNLGSYDAPDDLWQCFEIYVKLNTDGNSDGAYRVWFNGNEWYHVTGVRNRNDANARNFAVLGLADYGQSMTAPFQMWYDNIVISTQYVGSGPSKPEGIKVKSIGP